MALNFVLESLNDDTPSNPLRVLRQYLLISTKESKKQTARPSIAVTLPQLLPFTNPQQFLVPRIAARCDTVSSMTRLTT
jgi:hypothetical protein